MKGVLTPKQKQVLEFIQRYGVLNGFAPSQQEIATHFGFSSLGTVQNYIVRLERNGYLEKTWNGKRAIEVTKTAIKNIFVSNRHNHKDKKNSEELAQSINSTNVVPLRGHGKKTYPTAFEMQDQGSCFLPLLGMVAAGSPIEAFESKDSAYEGNQIEVPRSMVRAGREYFTLKVRGDSMIEDGILEGDIVVVEKSHSARNGQTVVALIDNEATIKRFEKGKNVKLHPANPRYEPIVVGEDREFKIEGIFAGLIRRA